jgi:hypothetical protein
MMSPYARVLLMVLTAMTVPPAEAACVIQDGLPAAGRCNAPEPPDGRVTARQLDEIMQWIAQRFELPVSAERPAVVFEAPADLARVRYGGFVTHASSQSEPGGEHRSGRGDLLAVYNDAKRIIHLSDDWTGTSEADLSVLVHEMVHHLQNMAGLKYNCAGDREKLAYRAQSAWLLQSGRSLESEFGLDRLSLIVHSNCM